jgi:hypothetical protein
MVNKTLPPNHNSADKKLANAVVQSLDNSLVDIDDLSLQRLKNARQIALNQPAVSTRRWVPLSAAASIAVFLMVPFYMHQHSTNVAPDVDSEIVSQDFPLSTEEMDDLDMLMALEDGDA